MDEIIEDDPDEDMVDPNDRRPMRLLDSRRQNDGEFSDSDDEGEGGRRDHTSNKERDTVGTGRRFGAAAVGIMSTGTTHGVGPSVAPPVAGTSAAALAKSADQSDMDVDEVPLAQSSKAKAQAEKTNGTVVSGET